MAKAIRLRLPNVAELRGALYCHYRARGLNEEVKSYDLKNICSHLYNFVLLLQHSVNMNYLFN